jgi:hypothetical protein
MHDRGMIKWAPFNSVINSKYLVNEIEYEKNKISKPTLSEEQIAFYEQIIKESMINKIPLSFQIYQGGYAYNINGIVTKIDNIKQKIYLNNHKYLYFCEIIKIKKDTNLVS